VLDNDHVWGKTRDIRDLPSVLVERLQHYFLTYKLVPGQRATARITRIYGRAHAFKVVEAAIDDCADLLRGGARYTHVRTCSLASRRPQTMVNG
jgi:inorganic pyrophosphatase